MEEEAEEFEMESDDDDGEDEFGHHWSEDREQAEVHNELSGDDVVDEISDENIGWDNGDSDVMDEKMASLIQEIFGSDDDDVEVESLEAVNFQQTNNAVFEEELGVLNKRRFVVSEDKLLELIRKSTCGQCGVPIDTTTIKEGPGHVSAGIVFTFTCLEGHKCKWISSEFYGHKSATGLLLQLMVLLSGMAWDKFQTASSFVKLSVGNSSSFFRNQRVYRVAVEDYFKKHMRAIHKSFGGRPLSVAIDTRYDSPGHSAKMATTVFMDTDSKNLVDIRIGDARQFDRKSNRLEKALVREGLTYLTTESSLPIWEVVSDASSTIKSLPRDTNKLIKRWMRILHHITNEHEWGIGRCRHTSQVLEPEGGEWLSVESKAYKALWELATDPLLLASFEYYTNNNNTSAVENFNSHSLLQYCSKRVAHGYDSYTIRNQLAVIDHNHHINRPVALKRNGDEYIQSHVSRRTKQWVAYTRKVAKDYSYIPDLMGECLKRIYGSVAAKRSDTSLSLNVISRNPSGGENPGSWELYQRMESRSSQGDDR